MWRWGGEFSVGTTNLLYFIYLGDTRGNQREESCIIQNCNSLLADCLQYLLNKLQMVGNNAVHLLLRVWIPETDRINSSYLVSPHRLPTDSWIRYSLSSVCYNFLNWTAPDYLTEANPPTTLLFWYFHFLPSLCMHPFAWSEVFFLNLILHRLSGTLPDDIRSSSTPSSFNSSLKTSLPVTLLILCVYVCVCQYPIPSVSSVCMHPLSWSEVIFLCCNDLSWT